MQAPYRAELHLPRRAGCCASLASAERLGQASAPEESPLGGEDASQPGHESTPRAPPERRPGLRALAAPLGLAACAGLLLLAPDSELGLATSGAVALIALHVALARVRGPAHALACGLAFGTAANAVALGSLVGLLMDFARLSFAAAAALALLCWLTQGLPYALAASLGKLAEARGAPRWLAFPLAACALVAWFPLLFPWQVATTQLALLPFVQVAELGGEALVSLLLLLATACLACALARRGSARRIPLLVFALSLALPSAFGMVRIPQVEGERSRAARLPIGVVQSNVGIDRKHDERRAGAILMGLQEMTAALERAGAELTLWGETAYPYPLLRSATRAPADVRAPLAHGVRGPLLMGLETYAGFEPLAAKFNSAWLVRRDGRLGERYDKQRLLAFGEFVPLWHASSHLRARYRHPGFSPGVPALIHTELARLGVLICYEDLFAMAARSRVQRGAQVLVNLTNDAWFGRSRAPHLHERASRMRAIEQRRDLVRAVNTGVSSFTSASGRSLLRTRTFTRASFVAEVRALDQRTPFSRLGDWVPAVCLLGLLGWLVRPRILTASPAP